MMSNVDDATTGEYSSRFYKAKKEALNNIGPMVALMTNARHWCEEASEKYSIDEANLKQWLLNNIIEPFNQDDDGVDYE
jgi:hypothetical protein